MCAAGAGARGAWRRPLSRVTLAGVGIGDNAKYPRSSADVLRPPLVDDATDETYVLSKMWGLQTEPALAALADTFPDAKVTFRRAATGDE